MYERSFGKLISSAACEQSPINKASSPANSQRRSGKSQASNGGSSRGTPSPSEGEADDPKSTASKATKRKAVQFADGSQDGSDFSSSAEAGKLEKKLHGKVSAREERSRRRQAKIDEDAPVIDEPTSRPDAAPVQSKKRQKTPDDGEVIKVKLLTGTLYLYRGKHRRAEFVRRL